MCAQPVSMLCKMMAKPTQRAFDLGLQVVKYMYQHRDRGVKYTKGGNMEPVCYYDASNKADVGDGKCQHGGAVYLAGGPVLWSSKKQRHVGTSASHNEYMALTHAAQQVVWMRQVLGEMGLGDMVSKPTPMMGDNRQANILSREDLVTPGNKYYILDYHFVKERIARGEITTLKVSGEMNLADPLTKSVSLQTMKRLRPAMTGYGANGLPEVPTEPRA